MGRSDVRLLLRLESPRTCHRDKKQLNDCVSYISPENSCLSAQLHLSTQVFKRTTNPGIKAFVNVMKRMRAGFLTEFTCLDAFISS